MFMNSFQWTRKEIEMPPISHPALVPKSTDKLQENYTSTTSQSKKSNAHSDSPANCPICGTVIRQYRNLRRHMELRHFGQQNNTRMAKRNLKPKIAKKSESQDVQLERTDGLDFLLVPDPSVHKRERAGNTAPCNSCNPYGHNKPRDNRNDGYSVKEEVNLDMEEEPYEEVVEHTYYEIPNSSANNHHLPSQTSVSIQTQTTSFMSPEPTYITAQPTFIAPPKSTSSTTITPEATKEINSKIESFFAKQNKRKCHPNQASDQPATCPICQVVIRQSRNLKRHIELQHVRKNNNVANAPVKMAKNSKPVSGASASTTLKSLY